MGRKPGSGRVCLQMSCRSISLLRYVPHLGESDAFIVFAA
jgi:hypothetical protein